MVDDQTYYALQLHYAENLLDYIQKHSGRWVLLDKWPNINESFFWTKFGVGRAIKKKYDDNVGYTIFVEKIPWKITEKLKVLIEKAKEPLKGLAGKL